MPVFASHLIGSLLIGASLQIASSPTDAVEASAQEQFDALAADYPALNATVMVGGEIAWQAEGGRHRAEEDGVEADYNIYSVAKMLVGMAYLRLEVERGLDLDTPVRRIDPTLPAQYEPVTLRHLLSHTSGIRHYEGPLDWLRFSGRRCDSPADALAYFVNDPLVSEPGEVEEYSTFGFVLLSHLLVNWLGADSFDAAMTEALGDAYRAHRDSADAIKAANTGRLFGLWYRIGELSAECKFGAGGLLMSSQDLAAMGSDLATGGIIPVDQLEVAFEAGGGAAASMGGAYSQSLDIHYASHSGGAPGGRAYLVVFVEPQVSVAITANYDGPDQQALAYGLARLFAGLPPAQE